MQLCLLTYLLLLPYAHHAIMEEVACQSHEPNVTAEKLDMEAAQVTGAIGMLDAFLFGLSDEAAAAAAAEAAQVTVRRADAPVVQQVLGGSRGVLAR